MKIEIYEDSANEYRWRMKARNGEIVAISGEGFTTKYACHKSITLVTDTFSSMTPIPINEVDSNGE